MDEDWQRHISQSNSFYVNNIKQINQRVYFEHSPLHNSKVYHY